MENKISQHISYLEATKSNTASRRGIDNTPSEDELRAMREVADTCFEPLRLYYDVPIGISSFFRSISLNEAIGGSKTSDHCKGMAIDVDADIYGGITNKQIFDFFRKNVLFTQLIWEFGTDQEPNWVHISFDPCNVKMQVLRAIRENGKTKYINM